MLMNQRAHIIPYSDSDGIEHARRRYGTLEYPNPHQDQHQR